MAINDYRFVKKIPYDGYIFDSKKELGRYMELKLMQRAKLIENLHVKPEFKLLATFKKNGKTFKGIKYIADFSYYDRLSNKIIVEDTKGFQTQVFKIKQKLFEHRYPDLTLILT